MSFGKTGIGVWRGWLLVVTGLLVALLLVVLGPARQVVAYHQFADQRTLLGLPHFWNVVSNLPFLGVGLYGLWLWFCGFGGGALSFLRPTYLAFFSGVALVAFGSAYYHWHPDSETLVWDRLPMTVAFMAFFAGLLAERVHARFASYGLLPALVVGAGSVFWWHWSGDLRPYVLVQFLPVVLTPLVVWLYPSRVPGAAWVWFVLVAYAGAKVLELYDALLYALLGISGHTLKHIAAAIGAYGVAALLRARVPTKPV